jgi:hypothetical protein
MISVQQQVHHEAAKFQRLDSGVSCPPGPGRPGFSRRFPGFVP